MDRQKADEVITEYLPKIYGFSIKNSFNYAEAEAPLLGYCHGSILRIAEKRRYCFLEQLYMAYLSA